MGPEGRGPRANRGGQGHPENQSPSIDRQVEKLRGRTGREGARPAGSLAGQESGPRELTLANPGGAGERWRAVRAILFALLWLAALFGVLTPVNFHAWMLGSLGESLTFWDRVWFAVLLGMPIGGGLFCVGALACGLWGRTAWMVGLLLPVLVATAFLWGHFALL